MKIPTALLNKDYKKERAKLDENLKRVNEV